MASDMSHQPMMLNFSVSESASFSSLDPNAQSGSFIESA